MPQDLLCWPKKTKYPLRISKYILANILRFRSDVTKAVTHWKEATDITKLDKIKGTVYLICKNIELCSIQYIMHNIFKCKCI